MKKYLVISALGPDRPGIVDEVSELCTVQHCNIEESRMAVLGGEFAIIVLVTGAEPHIAFLKQSLQERAQSLHLTLVCRETQATSPALARQSLPYILRVNGMDQEGLVHRITHLLALQSINIQDLATMATNAPVSGTQLFSLEARLELPVTVPLAELRDRLAGVCRELNIDFSLEAGAKV